MSCCTRRSSWYAANFRVTETLLIVGVMYFVAITILTWLANIVDRKVNR